MLAGALGSVASAQPAGSASDATRAQVALRNGRALDQKGDLAGALAAFESASKLAPEDTAILSELGWALYRNKDLERAASLTEDAVSRSVEPRLKAASLYNLGRIREAQGRPSEAIRAYVESYAKRKTTEARERLVGLVPRPEPIVTKPMTRVRDLQEFCKQEEARSELCKPGERDQDARFTCRMSGKLATTQPPYQGVQIWTTSCSVSTDSSRDDAVALQVGGQWFVSPAFHVADFHKREITEVQRLEFRLRKLGSVASEAPAVIYRYSWSNSWPERNGDDFIEHHSSGRYLILASIGASGVPSYVAPITESAESAWGSAALRIQYLPDGQVELGVPAGKAPVDLLIADVDLTKYLGTHRLVFP
jgi:tetratricopeptide (TPR) repeat protein